MQRLGMRQPGTRLYLGSNSNKREETNMTTITKQTRIDGAIETLIDAGNLTERIIERALMPTSLSVAQLRILCLADGEITPSQLAAQLRQETHSVSGLLNRLEDQDLVDRRRDRVDRRVVHVGLTHAGRALQANAMQLIDQASGEIAAAISPFGVPDLVGVRQDLTALYSKVVERARLEGAGE